MPDASIGQTVLDLKAGLNQLSKSSIAQKTRKWINVYPADIRPKSLEKILSQDWDALTRQARKNMKAMDTKLAEMKIQQKKISNVVKKAETAEETVTANWTPLTNRDKWAEQRKKIAEELKKKGIPAQAIESEISKLEDIKPKNIFQVIKKFLNSSVTHLDNFAQANLSYYMGSIFLLSVSRFNLAVKSVKSIKLPTEKALTKVQKDLSNKEQRIWSALKSKDLSKAIKLAQALTEWANDNLNDMTKYAAAVAKKRKQEPEDVKYGEMSLHIGDIIRDLLLAVAIGKRVDWLANWGASVVATSELIKAASSKKFSVAQNTNQKVEISVLAQDPSKYNGKEVTVKGFVGTVNIEHRSGKAISSAPIHDSNGNVVYLVLPYIKMDSGGLVKGSFARVSGTWNAKSNEINKPALQIGRRSLNEESKNSWIAWMEDSLRNIIEIIPHYLTAGWSWEPGHDGAVNSIRYGTWFERKGDK